MVWIRMPRCATSSLCKHQSLPSLACDPRTSEIGSSMKAVLEMILDRSHDRRAIVVRIGPHKHTAWCLCCGICMSSLQASRNTKVLKVRRCALIYVDSLEHRHLTNLYDPSKCQPCQLLNTFCRAYHCPHPQRHVYQIDGQVRIRGG